MKQAVSGEMRFPLFSHEFSSDNHRGLSVPGLRQDTCQSSLEENLIHFRYHL